jgi:hypothetical protein
LIRLNLVLDTLCIGIPRGRKYPAQSQGFHGACLLSYMLLLVVPFSWVAAVDLTPAKDRPYVGNSGDNSVLMLALEYNGIGRLDTDMARNIGKSSGLFPQGVNAPPGGGPGGRGGPGGSVPPQGGGTGG